MKKILIVLGTLLAACSLFQEKEERFVNPLFYKTLYPIPNTDTEKRLTPTKIYSKSVIPEEECKLLNNTERELIFSCEYNHPHGHRVSVLYKYVISNNFYTKDCQLIEQYTRHPDSSKWPSFPTFFCIHKDEI
ncbi:MAG: hypothetical protein J6Y85_01805 [Alphaproteobacteria bacterium]|nr:hypothetical protein [Alphaproteobacteria bacterium]